VAPANGPTSVTHRNPWRNARTEGRRPASMYVYGEVQRGQTRRAGDVARRRVPGRVQVFQGSSVWLSFSQNFSTEVDQVVNRKVVVCSTIYNFYKVRIGVFSTNFAQISSKLCCFLGAGE
jgi:hypothetical protein